MSKIFSIKISPDSDATILVAASKEGGATSYSMADDILETGADTLVEALDMVRTIGRSASDSLRDVEAESVEATIGLKLTAKGKFIVAEASAEATLEVKFTFAKPGHAKTVA